MKALFSHRRQPKGFTIIELMVSLAILTMIALFAGNIYINYTDSARNLKAANLLYEEGRFMMERIVREVRQGAVDYEEYFNVNSLGSDPALGQLGLNYCLYDQDFYSVGFDGTIGTKDDESLGERNTVNANPAPISTIMQDNLFLINLGGDERTYFTRIERDVSGETIGKLAMVKLIGKDFGEDGIDGSDSYNGDDPHNISCEPDARENDGLIDTWHCDPDYPCDTQVSIVSAEVPACDGYGHQILNDPTDANHSYVDISPNALNVLSLKFFISPEDDPWKAYKVNSAQIQPYITIQLTVAANPKLVSGIDDNRIPVITLTSTTTTRNYDEIKSSCI